MNKIYILFTIFYVIIYHNEYCNSQLIEQQSQQLINNEPIIGILAQEATPYLKRMFSDKYTSSIAASYVKYIESAGGRVVPIWIGQEENYYEDILSKINGVLLPGGATYFNNSKGYADAGMVIYKLARKMNKDGNYFPIWGTCLGFELLAFLSGNRIENRARCNSNSQSLNLDFKPDFKNSRLFGQASKQVINILLNENVTSNFHSYCLTERNFTDFGLDRIWKVLSTNKDWNGFEFISSFEHHKYPFYGVQFHPEKNLYEWIKGRNISHTPNAILASQYFANFFVNETRKNNNKFLNKNEEKSKLIYNYIPEYTGDKGSVFEQIYAFPQNYTGNQHSNNSNLNAFNLILLVMSSLISSIINILGHLTIKT